MKNNNLKLKPEDLEKDVDFIFDQCKKLLCTKGREYQNNTSAKTANVFNNFIRSGDRLGLNAETVLLTFMLKHIDSICTFIKDLEATPLKTIESKLSEPINGRIQDAINYLLILNSMVDQRRQVHSEESLKDDIYFQRDSEKD